jgi:hypothetical protein
MRFVRKAFCADHSSDFHPVVDATSGLDANLSIRFTLLSQVPRWFGAGSTFCRQIFGLAHVQKNLNALA